MNNAKPKQGFVNLKGKQYLQVNARVQWFREENPHGVITTEVVSWDPLGVKATVIDNDGNLMAVDHASAKPKPDSVYAGRELEKACTAAIGRALALCGYGTLGALKEDVEDDHLSDSPVNRRAPQGDRDRSKDAERLSNGGSRRVTTETNPAPANGNGTPVTNDWNAIFKAVQRHFGEPDEAGQRAHFKNLVSELRRNGLKENASDAEIIAAVNANREAEGKADKGWWNDKTTVADLSAAVFAECGITLPEALGELNQTMADFSSALSLKGAIADMLHFKAI